MSVLGYLSKGMFGIWPLRMFPGVNEVRSLQPYEEKPLTTSVVAGLFLSVCLCDGFGRNNQTTAGLALSNVDMCHRQKNTWVCTFWRLKFHGSSLYQRRNANCCFCFWEKDLCRDDCSIFKRLLGRCFFGSLWTGVFFLLLPMCCSASGLSSKAEYHMPANP